MRRIHIFFSVMLGAALISPQSYAQNCDFERDVIFTLKDPQIGSYSIWDTVWGERDEDESFSDIHVLPSKETLAVGMSKGHGEVQPALIFSQVRKNGRVRWVQMHEIEGLSEVLKILKAKDGYFVLANIAVDSPQAHFWIGHFDEAGVLKSENFIKDKDEGLIATDMIVVPDGFKAGGMHYFLSAALKSKDGREVAALYKLNSNAQVISRRVFDVGGANALYSLDSFKQKGFVASGYKLGSDGRKSGWALRLDEAGEFVWEREYPRGAGAELRAGAGLLSDAFVFSGSVAPLVEDSNISSWIIAVSKDNGTLLWQRYYGASLPLYGQDMLVDDQGVITMMVNAKALDVEGDGAVKENSEDSAYKPPRFDQSHVRLLIHDPRGALIDAEEYFNGEGAQAVSINNGANGERVVVGTSKVIYTDRAQGKPEEQPKKYISYEGWMASAVPVKEFKDPCAPKQYPKL